MIPLFLYLLDDHNWDQMLPLTFTRPVAELRIGILKIREKWECLLNTEISHLSREYLRIKYPTHFEEDNILINSSILPDHSILNTINLLEKGDSIVRDARILAARLAKSEAQNLNFGSPIFRKKIALSGFWTDHGRYSPRMEMRSSEIS